MALTTQITPLDHIINKEWSQPSPLVGSGFDSRSSDNALLTILYGSIERAALYDWSNAGRTLVDKTYLHILWQAKQIPNYGLTHHDIAPNVERFVREQLQPMWPQINQLIQAHHCDQTMELSTSLVTLAAQQLFGSNLHEEAASWLLFYLCPQLPIFPVNPPLLTATNSKDYISHHKACAQLLLATAPSVALPQVTYGRDKEQAMITTLLHQSDWWQRYCLVQQLQHSISSSFALN